MKLFGSKRDCKDLPEEQLSGEEGVLLSELHPMDDTVEEVWLDGSCEELTQAPEETPAAEEEISAAEEETLAETDKPAEAPAGEDEDAGEAPEDVPKEEADEEADEEEEAPATPLWKKSLISFGVFLVIFAVIAGCTVNYFLGLINYQAADSDYFETVSVESELEEETYEDSYLAALDEAEQADDLEATPEELERWNDRIDNITSDDSTYEIPISEDVYNILLIGTDNRTAGSVGRSDVMMLVSINQKTEKIFLTSFLRDCYVSIPGYGKTRLNHSYAYGGPDLLMETLETNFKVHVDKYVMVDFFSFMDVIDVLGGVWIQMSEEEVKIANKYIWSMNKLMDVEWSEDYLWGEGYGDGWRLLNGKQALAHARNRFTGSDYERTARQRTIINRIIDTAMESSPSTLVDLAQVILPQITTDMTKSEILSYAANIGAYVNYEIEQLQIPAAGTYSGATISGMSVISLDLEDNIQYLQDTIYAGTEYDESEE